MTGVGRSLEDGPRVSVVRQEIVNDVIPRRAYQDYSPELDLRASRDQQVARPRVIANIGARARQGGGRGRDRESECVPRPRRGNVHRRHLRDFSLSRRRDAVAVNAKR